MTVSGAMKQLLAVDFCSTLALSCNYGEDSTPRRRNLLENSPVTANWCVFISRSPRIRFFILFCSFLDSERYSDYRNDQRITFFRIRNI